MMVCDIWETLSGLTQAATVIESVRSKSNDGSVGRVTKDAVSGVPEGVKYNEPCLRTTPPPAKRTLSDWFNVPW